MRPSSFLRAATTLAASAAVWASSSFSQPCFSGTCTYHIPASKDSMWGTVLITGSPTSVSDITDVSGWAVLNCSTGASTQDIRLVCASEDHDCDHLFQGGAEGTIVRLPQNCGRGPFARVAKSWVSEDQAIPEHVAKRLTKRNGVLPQVRSLSVDPHFHKVDTEGAGAVNIVVMGSSHPGVVKIPSLSPDSSERRSIGLYQRDLANTVDLAIRSFKDATDDGTTFNENTTFPINVDTTFNVINQTIPCTGGDDTLSVDFEARADAQVMIAFVVAGTLAPPNITEAAFFANMSAELNGSLALNAGIVGTFDTGRVGPLFSLPIPGASLTVPEIITVGPSFNIFSEATFEIDIDVNLGVNLAYHVDNLQLVFPPSDGHPSNATVTPQDSPLALSVTPGITSNATITAHLIPSLNLGLTTFGDDASASIFLDLDSSASLTLSLDATGSTSNSGDSQGQINGCVGVNGGMSVNAGAEGSFFDLFDNTTQVALFQRELQLFQQCFKDSKPSGPGTENSSRRLKIASISTLIMQLFVVLFVSTLISFVGASPAGRTEARAEKLATGQFTCPAADLKPVASVVNQVLSSSHFKGL